jgi:hypothetical protein
MKPAHAVQIVNSTKLFNKTESLFYSMFDVKGTIEELPDFSCSYYVVVNEDEISGKWSIWHQSTLTENGETVFSFKLEKLKESVLRKHLANFAAQKNIITIKEKELLNSIELELANKDFE